VRLLADAPTPANGEGAGGRPRWGGAGKEMIFSFLYSLDTWAIDVIGMVENVELYQTFCEISDSLWSCSVVDLRGSATLELLPNTPLLLITGSNFQQNRGFCAGASGGVKVRDGLNFDLVLSFR
jgi:hypothetical protein